MYFPARDSSLYSLPVDVVGGSIIYDTDDVDDRHAAIIFSSEPFEAF